MKLFLLTVGYFFDFLKLSYKADRKNLIIVMFCKILVIPIPIVTIYIAKLIMDEVALCIKDPSHGYTTAFSYLAIELGILIAGKIIGFIKNLSESKFLLKMEVYYSKKFFDKMSKVEFKHLENTESLSIIYDGSNGSETGYSLINNGFSLISSFSQMVALTGLVFSLSPYIALLILVVSTISFYIDLYFAKKSEELRKSDRNSLRYRSYLSNLLTYDHNAKEIIALNAHDQIVDKYFSNFYSFRFKSLNLDFKQKIVSMSLDMLSDLLYYGSYAWLIIRTVSQKSTLGDLTLYLSVFSRVSSGVQSIYNGITQFYKEGIRVKNVLDFYSLSETIPEGVSKEDFDKILSNPSIEFNNVSFKYEGSQKYVIKNISFFLQYGQKVALVGENGAGKSTIIKLITGLYKPTEGKIFLGGIDITLLSRKQIADLFSVVFQDFVNFRFLFKESVTIANIKAEEEKYKTALTQSGADKIAENFPLKDAQPLTSYLYENGVGLSGGQWQKIALARAFIKDSKVLILDEPTAAIDANQEFEIFSKFQELTKGKTSILVSHRFSTVRMAELIVFLENGEIIEKGSHQELIKLNGKYATMFNKQAIGYL